MTGELNQNTEMVINLHCCIRDYICKEMCSGGRHCSNMICLKSFFEIAGQIELKAGMKDVDKS